MMYVAEFFEKNGGFQRQRSGTVVLWTPPGLREGALVLPALLFAQDGVHPEPQVPTRGFSWLCR